MENADGSKVEAGGFGFAMFHRREDMAIRHIPIHVCIKCGCVFGDLGVIANEPLSDAEIKRGHEIAAKHGLLQASEPSATLPENVTPPGAQTLNDIETGERLGESR